MEILPCMLKFCCCYSEMEALIPFYHDMIYAFAASFILVLGYYGVIDDGNICLMIVELGMLCCC
jgi:hypothetical protein